MIQAFQKNLPEANSECEDILSSDFFNLKFDIIIAWGVVFCFNAEEQNLILTKVSKHLKSNGKFIFTAPTQKAFWTDVMTGQQLESLGRDKYLNLFEITGLKLEKEFQDSGENHYYELSKVG